MSILLEALRKSEKNQQVREAPTIHSDDQGGTVSESLPVGPLAVLLIIALFLGGWLIWRQYQPPAGNEEPQVTLEAGSKKAISNPLAVEQQESQQESQPAPSRPETDGSVVQMRTPVESYQPPEGGETATLSTAQEQVTSTASKPATRATTSRSAGPGQTTGSDFPEPAQELTQNEPKKTRPERYDPGELTPLGYWDLPDAVRSEVPEIKFSVLVYAADPADRFVLINGQRLAEGDSAQPGLVVEEIQRDGVLFSYRLYRFLVKR
jgi:general secretion pathway protein B